MKRRCRSRLVLALSLIAFAVPVFPAQTFTLVLPREVERTFGNARIEPLFFGRFEQIYASSEFSDLPVDSILITDIGFRIDESEYRWTNVVGSRFVMQMNVFGGSLGEIVERRTGQEEPVVTVFQRNEVRLSGRPGELPFDVRFQFQEPFLYNRRLGHLVLAIQSEAGGNGVVDLEKNVSGDRGFHGYLDPGMGSDFFFFGGMIATELSYLIPFNIQKVRKFADVIEIIFSYSGSAVSIQIESSDSAQGPFKLFDTAQFNALSPCSMRATIRSSGDKQFFRIRQDTP